MTGAQILDSRYSWQRLALSLLISIIGSVGMWAVIVVLPGLQSDFGLDRADSTLPYTLTMIGFAFGNMAVGRIVDRLAGFGRVEMVAERAKITGGVIAIEQRPYSLVR